MFKDITANNIYVFCQLQTKVLIS